MSLVEVLVCNGRTDHEPAPKRIVRNCRRVDSMNAGTSLVQHENQLVRSSSQLPHFQVGTWVCSEVIEAVALPPQYQPFAEN